MKSRMLLGLGVLLAMGSAGAEAQQTKQLSIATGGTGGIYYPLAGGFGTILAKEIPGITATAEVTGGSIDNMKLVGAGNADVAFTQVDTAVDAVNGRDKFPKKLPIRALAVMYVNLMQVVTLEGNGVTKFADLKGKVDGVSVRAPVPDGSLTDLVVQLGSEATVDEVNNRYRDLADTGPLSGILRYSDEPLVSSDIVGSSYSCIFDSKLTMAHGRTVKVFGWYDNEWGYSSRLVDLVERL